jgi:hypothetical protein
MKPSFQLSRPFGLRLIHKFPFLRDSHGLTVAESLFGQYLYKFWRDLKPLVYDAKVTLCDIALDNPL